VAGLEDEELMGVDSSAHDAPVLFGIDVHSIQKYLFATPKLREIVGASQIVSDFTCAWPMEELAALGSSDHSARPGGLGAAGFLPVRVGGGCTRLVLPDGGVAAKLALAMHRRAVERAPGLAYDVAWVPFDTDGGDLASRQAELIGLLTDRRNRPRRGAGFAGFPFSAPCRLTRDPAVGHGEDRNERLCEASLAKRFAQWHSRGDWVEAVGDHEVLRECRDPERPFEFEISRIADDERGNAYVAVVCVDLNDLGEKGRRAVGEAKGRVAAARFHAFSEQVKAATGRAFAAALSALAADPIARMPLEASRRLGHGLPVRPLVMGGDDLVFVLHAACGVPFALALLDDFMKSGFAGAAGIAFVKAKSPLGRSVRLAEELVSAAKVAGRDASRIDFLTCTGEVPRDLADTRDALRHPDRRLTSGPWTVPGFRDLVQRARALALLPRGHVRGAVDRCHAGLEEGRRAFDDLRENLVRGLGGRRGCGGQGVSELVRAYPDGFFVEQDGVISTDLADCVDLFRFVAGADGPPIGEGSR